MIRPLRRLMEEHRRLDRLLQEHQVALVERRMAAAGSAWQAFTDLLLGHIRAEEEVVLPEYEARVTPARGGEADIFKREHRRLQRFVDEVQAWLAAWGAQAWPATEVILLLERQKTLKEILEHHDQREAEHLYPALEGCMAAPEQEQILARFRAVEALPSEPRPPVSDPAGAALRAAGWLRPLYDELVAGTIRPRATATWREARERLQVAMKRLQGEKDLCGQVGILEEMARLLDEVTPMKRFPASRGSQVHACWQLLQAALRAAQAAAGPGLT